MGFLPSKARREHVLVVDDDPLVRRVARRTLEHAGLAVTTAGSQAEALRHIASSQSFDAALLDYFLAGDECGCDLIAPLRARHRTIRIIVLSGLGVLGDLVRHAQAAGADLVTSKTAPDWPALARCRPVPPRVPVSPAVDLAALKREIIHGTYLVHRRNISMTARALGITRSSLQRRLRKSPIVDPDTEGEE